MADPVLSQKLKAGIGGTEWRVYEITHTGEATCTVDAKDLDLDYIESIVGESTCVAVVAKSGSTLCGMGVSISADHKHLVWVSTCACVQYVTVTGW